LVEHLHGKEGVSGSSPEEGLKRSACKTACAVAYLDSRSAAKETMREQFLTPSAF
jgi:hypothetical protein